MEECDYLIIRPPIAIGATMEEWNVGRMGECGNSTIRQWKRGILEYRKMFLPRRHCEHKETQRNGQIFDVEQHL